MKNNFFPSVCRLLSVLFLFIIILISGCSKEKRIERSLHKKDGSWSVSSADWTSVVQDTSGQSINMGSTANTGNFIFEKEGSGTYNFTVNGEQYNSNFTWNVSGEVISITSISQTIFGGISQKAISFSGEQTGKNSITLKGSIVEQYFSGTIEQKSLSGTFYLSK